MRFTSLRFLVILASYVLQFLSTDALPTEKNISQMFYDFVKLGPIYIDRSIFKNTVKEVINGNYDELPNDYIYSMRPSYVPPPVPKNQETNKREARRIDDDDLKTELITNMIIDNYKPEYMKYAVDSYKMKKYTKKHPEYLDLKVKLVERPELVDDESLKSEIDELVEEEEMESDFTEINIEVSDTSEIREVIGKILSKIYTTIMFFSFFDLFSPLFFLPELYLE